MSNIFQSYQKQRQETDEFGFKWRDHSQIIEQIKSECDEVSEAIENNTGNEHLKEELGDVILSSFDLASHLGFDIEEIIENSIKKLDRHFTSLRAIALKHGYKTLEGLSIEQMLDLWNIVKEEENSTNSVILDL